MMLLGGCASSGARSAVIRLANSAVPRDVGLYTFNIYLVQDMLAAEVLKLQAFSAGSCNSYLKCNALVMDGMYTGSPYGSFDSLWWCIYAIILVGLCKAWYMCARASSHTRAAPPALTLSRPDCQICGETVDGMDA